MPKVVRFSVFFPSLSSSSAVWAQTKAHQEHSNAASVFFMISPFERAIVSLPHEGEDARRRGARSLWGTVREPNGAGSTLRSGLALLVRRGRLVGFPVHIRRRAEALFHVFEIRLRAVGHQRGGTATGAFRARQGRPSPRREPVR